MLIPANLSFIRILLILAAAVVCIKATKALVKIAMVIAAMVFLWPYIAKLLEQIF